MLSILWFLSIAVLVSISLVFVLDHEGLIIVRWLDYQVQTDILTGILLAIIFTIFVFFISYILARILAFKFPNLIRIFFNKKYVKNLEKTIKKQDQALDLLATLALALEVDDKESAKKLSKEFAKLEQSKILNHFYLGKLALVNQDFSKACDEFSLIENNNAKILVLKSKTELALKNQDEISAIAYAKQILSIKNDDVKTAKTLLRIYKKRCLWQEAQELVAEYGEQNLQSELQKNDVALINYNLALSAYRQKKFRIAGRYAKIALKAEESFLPARELLLKSWLKRGFAFAARYLIKSIWRKNPQLVLAEIFDFSYRKSGAKTRIKNIKKLASLNKNSHLSDLAVGLVAYRVNEYAIAKEFLNLSLIEEKTCRAYGLLALIAKAEGDMAEFERYKNKAKNLSHTS